MCTEKVDYESKRCVVVDRLKFSYKFLTIVATICVFVFLVLMDTVQTYQDVIMRSGVDIVNRMLAFFVFMFSLCIVLLFSALQSISVDGRFNTIIKKEDNDDEKADLYYTSISECAEYGLNGLGLIFLMLILPIYQIDFLFDIKFVVIAAITIVFVICPIACMITAKFYKKCEMCKILLKRCVLWICLSLFLCPVFYQLCYDKAKDSVFENVEIYENYNAALGCTMDCI